MTADRVVENYQLLAAALPPPPADAWLSVDLTHLALDSSPSDAADRLVAIANALSEGRRVQVGAEDSAHTDAVLTCVLDVAERGLADRLGATLQEAADSDIRPVQAALASCLAPHIDDAFDADALAAVLAGAVTHFSGRSRTCSDTTRSGSQPRTTSRRSPGCAAWHSNPLSIQSNSGVRAGLSRVMVRPMYLVGKPGARSRQPTASAS